MEKIKVFLSDPQILFREGMHFTLSGEDDFEVTGDHVSFLKPWCYGCA